MAQVSVGVLIEKREEEENKDRDAPDEISVKLLSDTELQEKLLAYGAEPGPILPSTRILYEKKLLQLVNPNTLKLCAKPNPGGDLDRSSDSEGEKETSTEIVLETKDFKVTAACATGYCKVPHTDVSERHKKLLAPDADYSLAKIVAELEQILPEDKLSAHRTQGQKRSGGSSPRTSRRTKAADTTGTTVGKDDGHGETWLPDLQSPIGISPARRRSVRERDQSTQEVAEKPSVEKEKPQAHKEKPKAGVLEGEEPHRGIIPMPIRIAILAVFVFVLFVYVTMETSPDNPVTNFITGRAC